ncbi:MAG: hypothetical protein H6854_00820 [Rhodospirillales bacterium]|nr:hypothetical protein [Rhodospirillales bacterium]
MNTQKGNAFIYVLIAVILFAALSFVLMQQEDSKETGTLSPETAKILSTQLITTATQIKGALDQMIFAGTTPEEFDFRKPGAFGATPHVDKVFHPEGGGVTLPPLPDNALPSTALSGPNSGWYLGRFNNVEWTPTTEDDVILTAYGIDRMVCEEINRTLTGSTTIPVLGAEAKNLLVDDGEYSGSNADFTIASCGTCESVASLCVANPAQTAYAFYNVLFAE